MHEIFIDLVLSLGFGYALGALALLLMILYLISYKIQPKILLVPRRVRRASFLVRAVNWGVFGVIFITFSVVTRGMGLETWRATARLALFFLVLAEIAYETGALWSFKKEISEWAMNT